MNPVIDVLAPSEIDRLEQLWGQLLAHHNEAAGHLAALAPVRSPEDSWRLRRDLYLAWLKEPHTAVLLATDEGRPLGYAVVRVVGSPGSWQWGDRVGVLETLVVADEVRGLGVGQALLRMARERLARLDVQVVKISVMAGNDSALRFYRREGALDFTTTLVMPVRG
jgi:ribosomal protein S18 acetylase RimI-like enzyme